MKAISVYDLKLIPELSHLNYFEMVDPKNDHLVNPFLKIMGFDLDYALQYTVSQHRTMQGTVEIGYVIRGEVNISRDFLTSEWATLDDRLIAAAYTDPSLCKAMCGQLNTSLNYTAFHDGGTAVPEAIEDFPECLTNPDEAEILEAMKQLEVLLLEIRGSQYKEDGSHKLPHEYHEEPVVVVKRKRHVRKEKTKSE
jgi:hypothetical protein